MASATCLPTLAAPRYTVVEDGLARFATMLATKEKNELFFPLAALLPQNEIGFVSQRVVENSHQGPTTESEPRVGPPTFVSSTLQLGSTFCRYESASARLVQRYYGVGTGRFWSADPAGMGSVRLRSPQSWNRYVYAGDDPVNNFDPTGRSCILEGGLWVDDGDDYGCDYVGMTEQMAASYQINQLGTVDIVGPTGWLNGLVDGTYYYHGQPIGEVPLQGADDQLLIAISFLSSLQEAMVNLNLPSNAAPTILGQTMTLTPEGTLLPGYVEIAGIVGGRALSYPSDVWIAMTREAQEGAMQGWINGALRSGSQIVFIQDPALAPAGTGTFFEYKYITETLGKQIVQQGTSWVVIP